MTIVIHDSDGIDHWRVVGYRSGDGAAADRARIHARFHERRFGAMATTELQMFLGVWDAEAQKTAALLRALPAGQYDFRPDAGARSLGELAWHLAEADAYVSWGIEQGKLAPGAKAPGLERPRSIEALAPGYERVHAEAVARVRRLGADDLDRRLTYFDGK